VNRLDAEVVEPLFEAERNPPFDIRVEPLQTEDRLFVEMVIVVVADRNMVDPSELFERKGRTVSSFRSDQFQRETRTFLKNFNRLPFLFPKNICVLLTLNKYKK
jgi:hypothetical protein